MHPEQKKPRLQIKDLLSESQKPGVAAHRSLGNLIRMVDDCDPACDEIDEIIKPSAFRAARIGLTGPPGAGKSSLIAASLEHLTSLNKKIGILAVDPTSPFSGGAVLGDRVRLKKQPGENVFFRSLASRGWLGGVSRAVWQASRLLDWWGADVIIIETVGSGQLGIGIADVSDVVVIITTPESGDSIQSLKAGIMELADCFIVNKCDRPGADLTAKELGYLAQEAGAAGREVLVYQTSAANNTNIHDACNGIAALWRHLDAKGEIRKRRHNQVRKELAVRIDEYLQTIITSSMGGLINYTATIESWADKILKHESTCGFAASQITSLINLK